MTKQEIILQTKLTALNAIRNLYKNMYKHDYTYYEGEGSRMEQISFDVKRIVENLDEELLRLKKL